MESSASLRSHRWTAVLLGFATCAIVARPALAAGSSAGLVLVRAGTVTDLPGAGSPPLPAGQDGDGFPDTDETVVLPVFLSNKSGQVLTNVAVRLFTTDSRIDCISNPVAIVGTVAPGTTVAPAVPFRLRVASTADRGGAVPPATCVAGLCSNGAGACSAAPECARTALDVYAARLHATVTADQLAPEGETDVFDVELDLDAPNLVTTTSTFVEGFEGGLANMVLMNLDADRATNALSDGTRCQYSDPDFPNADTYGETMCYLGFAAGQSPVNDWHLHHTGSSDGGRARAGSRSLHWAVETPGNPGLTTYHLSQMDGIRTRDPVRLAARVCQDDAAPDKRTCNADSDCVAFGGGPCVAASPELSLAHQISTLDSRFTATAPGMAIDRGVVQAQVEGSSVWRKLVPYLNVYDVQASDQFTSCTFDPDDDGNDEDDFYAPADPARRYGPSATCYPEWAFSYLGDTDEPFAADRVGRASDGPGLPGSLGIGTWVESKYDLSSFRGRAVHLRWLITSVKVSDFPTVRSLFRANPVPYDDGWWVDDVRVTHTVPNPPVPALDSADRSSLPSCASGCAGLAAALASDPSTSGAPAAPVTLHAQGSTAAVCPDEALLFEYGVDGDGDGSLGGLADWMVAGPTTSEQATVAPLHTTTYGVRVRCASDPSCFDDQTASVEVECPPAQSYSASAWWSSLRMEWWKDWECCEPEYRLVTNDAGQHGEVAHGDLFGLVWFGRFDVFGTECLGDDWPLNRGISDPRGNPPAGQGYWYLLRGTEPTCNETESFSTYHPKENPGDPGKRDREITVCDP